MIINLKPIKQLTASELYSKVNQEDIYSYYLGEKIRPDKLYHCCFHKDSTPSLGFYKTKYNNIRFKCFGCGEDGSTIEFVMKLRDLNYPQALNQIQYDFGNFKTVESIISTNKINTFEIKESISERLKIIPIERPFSIIDKEYWKQFELDLIDIYKSGIRACSVIYYKNKDDNTKIFCHDTKNNPVYSIRVSKGIYKIYRPLNPTKFGKWFANTGSEDLQGLDLLSERRKLLIITSSMKDVMVLSKLGYEAIAPCGEGVRIPDKVMDYLIATSDKIVYFNDADSAGYKYTFKLSKETGLPYIFIPRIYNIKDISDFVKEYGIKEADKLMKTLLKRIGIDGEREK